MKSILPALIIILMVNISYSQKMRLRDHGIAIGVLSPGVNNAITDVPGVKVGHLTLNERDHIRSGVTAILPHEGNIFQQKVPAAIYIGNGFGKLMGYSQVKELGEIETPVVLTNTLSVAVAANALVSYTLDQPENREVRSVNPVVGETNDGYLNDIRGRHVTEDHIFQAIASASSSPVDEGNVGAGTGTICFGWKGGIGTSSRKLPESRGRYTVGVLAQTNFGGVLQIAGVPIGKELKRYAMSRELEGQADGSCMIAVITDAPVNPRNLERMAKRAMLGLARTGGIASNGSGDYVIAMSVAPENLVPYSSDSATYTSSVLRNDAMTPLFLATIEATEEAILNSLFAAETMVGRDGHKIDALPVDKVLELMQKYGRP